jgi:hypothetical protein
MTLIYIRTDSAADQCIINTHTYSCKAYSQATECLGSQSIVHLRHNKGWQDSVRLR